MKKIQPTIECRTVDSMLNKFLKELGLSKACIGKYKSRPDEYYRVEGLIIAGIRQLRERNKDLSRKCADLQDKLEIASQVTSRFLDAISMSEKTKSLKSETLVKGRGSHP